MRLRRARLRTTRTMVGITTIYRVIMPQWSSMRKKTRTKKARLIYTVAFSDFILARRVVQRETAQIAGMRRECRV